jgi:iron complex outermembrane receptor protein
MKSIALQRSRRLFAAAASLAAVPLWAQPAPSAAPAVADETVQLEPVTVTATLREKPLQQVPVAITVVNGSRAEQANLNNLFDIAADVPSLTFRTNSSNKDTSLFIRGVGTVTTSPGVEPSVSTVVDGVVLARPGQATLDLFDIERVEVLRGSQGTLFGKNASAGVINIVTKDPAKETAGYVDTSYFSGGDEFRFRAGASGEVKPDLARVSVNAIYATYDGNVTNAFNGDTVNGYDKSGVRGKVVLTPSATSKITFAADYLKTDSDTAQVPYALNNVAFPNTVTATNPAVVAALDPATIGKTNRTVNQDDVTTVADTNWGLSGTAEFGLGDFTLTSITAYREWDNTQLRDGDFRPNLAAGFPRSRDRGIVDISQLSQELRLASPTGGFLEYVAGLYYFSFDNAELYRRDVRRIIGLATVDDFGAADYGTSSDSYAAYGESTLNFTDSFRAIGGLRLTHDTLEYYHDRFATAAGVPGVAVANPAPYVGRGETDETALSGRVGLQFDVSKKVTTYATYSRGYKGPAYNVFFNHNQFQGDPLEPETSDNFEVGVKTSSLEDRLIVNVALFDSTFHNHQADFGGFVNGVFATNLVNAGTVTTRGIELDAVARPTNALTLSAAVTFAEARVDDFANPTNNPAFAINGKPLPCAPDWKATLGGNYRLKLSEGYALDFATDYNWQSEVQYQLRQNPDTIQDSFGIWNGSIALANLPGRWRATLHVKNITDQSYAAFLSQGGGIVNRIVPRDDSRYFGVSFRKDF